MADASSDFYLVNYRLMMAVGAILGLIGGLGRLWGMVIFGLLLIVFGLANKSKWGKEKRWSELTPAQRKGQVIGLISAAVLGIAAIVVSVLFTHET